MKFMLYALPCVQSIVYFPPNNNLHRSNQNEEESIVKFNISFLDNEITRAYEYYKSLDTISNNSSNFNKNDDNDVDIDIIIKEDINDVEKKENNDNKEDNNNSDDKEDINKDSSESDDNQNYNIGQNNDDKDSIFSESNN